MSTPTSRPHVAVVGAGPVGLAAALLLHRAGVQATVLERMTGPSGHPKARGVRTRTMELFARWGLGDAIRANGLPAEANRFIYCDSLAGEEIGRSAASDPLAEKLSPVNACRVAQDAVEEVLLHAVSKLDAVAVRRGANVVALDQDDDRVMLATESGERVVADFVIAADGVGSTVRQLLGIELEGQPLLGYGQSVYWRGDLSPWVRDRQCIQFLTGHRLGRPASIAPVDGVDRWVTMVIRPGKQARPEPPTPEEAVEIIRGAVGADVDPQILDIATWRLSAQVATRWRVGRVFLAGDAAHSFPPTGGFGMNTGVQDVDNLVWKLRLTMDGVGGDQLLDTYEAERIDIARSNAAWSVANGDRIRHIGNAIATDDRTALERLLGEQRHHVDATDQDLGFGYAAGAIAGEDHDVDPLRLARRGHRFPEVPVIASGEKRSSVLTLGDRFTVVTTDPALWTALPITSPEISVVQTLGGLPEGSPGVLVRPDGVVAWVATAYDGPDRLPSVLDEVLRR